MNHLARRTTSWLYRIASISSILLVGLTGCGGGGGSGQPAGVSRNPTELDISYGNQGQVTFPLGVRNAGVGPAVLQTDGKLLIAGWRQTGSLSSGTRRFTNEPKQVYVIRLNGDGSPDTTFGVGGEARYNVKGSDTVTDIKVQSDGKILLAVDSIEPCDNSGFLLPCLTPSGRAASLVNAVVRLTTQGGLDSSFGGTGVVEKGAIDTGQALAVQADGKILSLRSTTIERARIYGWRLARYNADGTLDPTFIDRHQGKCQTDVAALAVQGGGKIVVGGWGGLFPDSFCLERVNADGSDDASFSSSGFRTTFGMSVRLDFLSALPSGRLLALGNACDAGSCGLVAARYDAEGLLDTSFGDAGIVRKLAFFNTLQLLNYALMPDGGFIAFGYPTPNLVTGEPVKYQPTWIRLDANGQPVSGFGVDGILFGASDTKRPRDFVRDSEGRWLVIYVSTLSDGNLGLAVTRFVGERL